MSTDFIALFDVTAEDVTLQWLLDRVRDRPEVFADFVERYGHAFRPKEWGIEAGFSPEARPSLCGPGGFAIRLERRFLELWHGIRFGMFTGDAWHRDTLRRICRAMAGLVGSGRAIYTHELMPHAGNDGLAGIEAELRARIGPPADTFEELHAAEYFGPRAWYVDHFPSDGQ